MMHNKSRAVLVGAFPTIRMKSKAISAFLFAMILGFGMLATATPAQAASLVSLSDGQIVGKGTAIQGTYTATCVGFDDPVYVRFELRQRAGGRTINTASFYDDFQCAGDGVPVTRTYTFTDFGTTFKHGTATINGYIQECACCSCNYETIFQEITLVKAK